MRWIQRKLEGSLGVSRLVEVQVNLVRILRSELVESGLVGTARLQKDGCDPLGSKWLTIDDFNVHATTIENSQDVLLLDRDSSLLHDRNILTNPGKGDELVTLRHGGTAIVNTLNKEGSEGNLSIIKVRNEVIETTRTSSLDSKGLSITTKGEKAPKKNEKWTKRRGRNEKEERKYQLVGSSRLVTCFQAWRSCSWLVSTLTAIVLLVCGLRKLKFVTPRTRGIMPQATQAFWFLRPKLKNETSYFLFLFSNFHFWKELFFWIMS